MGDVILDSEQIIRLSKLGWSRRMIAARYGISARSLAQSLRNDRWYSDPTLRERWRLRLPRMKKELRDTLARLERVGA